MGLQPSTMVGFIKYCQEIANSHFALISKAEAKRIFKNLRGYPGNVNSITEVL